jgi:hypothetical protein
MQKKRQLGPPAVGSLPHSTAEAPLKNTHLGAGVAIIESSKNLFCAIRASRV